MNDYGLLPGDPLPDWQLVTHECRRDDSGDLVVVRLARPQLSRCQCTEEGDCHWPHCPQVRDREPELTGRLCPLITHLEVET